MDLPEIVGFGEDRSQIRTVLGQAGHSSHSANNSWSWNYNHELCSGSSDLWVLIGVVGGRSNGKKGKEGGDHFKKCLHGT